MPSSIQNAPRSTILISSEPPMFTTAVFIFDVSKRHHEKTSGLNFDNYSITQALAFGQLAGRYFVVGPHYALMSPDSIPNTVFLLSHVFSQRLISFRTSFINPDKLERKSKILPKCCFPLFCVIATVEFPVSRPSQRFALSRFRILIWFGMGFFWADSGHNQKWEG